MDLTLRINSDFSKASEAFKSLADSSEETREKIEKFSEAFQEKHINKFIDKQKLLEASLTGTRGEVDAMKAASNNYQKEIERLIRSGLDPQSDAIKKLSQEHDLLNLKIKETENSQKTLEQTMKTLETASFALLAAIGATTGALIAITNETAKAGDEFAKAGRHIGLTAEELQELDYAAKMSGVSDIRGHLDKLNTAVINVKNDTGALTKYLEENDKQLLNQVKSAKSNSQAFDLLMQAIKNTQDPFKKSELAMAAFGKAGKDIILMAEQGADGIANLREEAHLYGLISNEAAQASENYIDAQTRLKKSFEGVRNEIGSSLMPIVTDIMQKVADAIASVDNWDEVFRNLIITVGAVTGALVTFVTVLKIAPIIQGVVVAIKAAGGALAALRIKILAVNTAIAANPIGLIATGIAAATGLIVGVIGSAISKQKEYTKSFDENTDAVNRNSSAVANNMLLINDAAFEASRGYNDLTALVSSYNDELRILQATQSDLRRLENEGADSETIDMYRRGASDAIEWIDRLERRIRALATLRGQVFSNGELQDPSQQLNIGIELNRDDTERAVEETKTLIERLRETIINTETQNKNEQIEIVKSFLLEKAELEAEDHEQRLEYLEQRKSELLAIYEADTTERIAIEEGYRNAVLQIEKDLAKQERELLNQRLSAMSDFFGSMENLTSAFAEKNRTAMVLSKLMALAQVAINTAIGISNAIAQFGPPPNPMGIAGIAAAVATGVASTASIIATSIPSAETGGRFIVPNSNGVDSHLMRVNSGEEINVTPRGMTGENESFNFQFLMDGKVFAEITNKLARNGELYTLQLAGNL
jgi:hypothetical protein